jgi:MFS family permease
VPRVAQTVVVDGATAESMLTARTSPVVERPSPEPPHVGPDGARRAAFDLARGPMLAYRREVAAVPLDDGRVEVTEETHYRLALGVWSLAVVLPTNHGLKRLADRQSTKTALWAPPDNLDARAGSVLGLLLTLSLLAGYMGTVLTQTITYAADEFGRGATAQGTVLASVRVGVLGALAIVALADRRGRRKLLILSVGLACIATAAGALAPSIEVLGMTQTVARGFQAATTLLLTVVAAEEMPKGARAYAISVMTMTGALGAGIAVWALPLADVGERGWRIIFLLALLGLPVVRAVHRHLPESKRFVRPHRQAGVLRGHARRLWAIGAALFCASAFGAPSAQLLNDFLKDERGFSASRIALFTVLTSTPAGIALVAGGRLADTRGRRHVVAIGVAGGAIVAAWGFTQAGWSMWIANLVATMLGALSVPAMGVYGPELFPTAARAKANGVLQVVSVAGSALGLVVAGVAIDRTGSLSTGMFLLLPLALVVAVLALTVFPETARRELEAINPEDDMSRPGDGEVLAGPH